jgi:hypothetical protein
MYAPDEKSNDKGKNDRMGNTPKSKQSLGLKDSSFFQPQSQSTSPQGGQPAPEKAYSPDSMPKCPPAPPQGQPRPGPGANPAALPGKR